MTKRYKMVAHILSSGLWDSWGNVTLQQMQGERDEALDRDLQRWQDAYDDHFKCYPYGL